MEKENTKMSVEELLKDEFFIRWVSHPDEESNHYWMGVMNARPELREVITKAREVFNLISYDNSNRLSDGEYSEMLDVLIHENRLSKYKKGGISSRFSWVAVAASILLATSIGFAYYFTNFNEGGSPFAAISVAQVEKAAKKGEKLTIKLPDGTSVKLNSNTTLSYKSAFDGRTREVILEGEAYFDVAEDPERPFIIHTADINTTVLGTEFNIRSYSDEGNIEVAVVEGKVRVEHTDDNFLFLTSNEVSTYQKDDQRLEKEKRDVRKLVAWNENVLVFNSATSEEVWKTLENWYGVNITIKNKKNIVGRYSGEYDNEPLETVLRGISFASGFSFEIDEYKNVTIK